MMCLLCDGCDEGVVEADWLEVIEVGRGWIECVLN